MIAEKEAIAGLVFIGFLLVSFWLVLSASSKTRQLQEFLVAGNSISGFRNGLAIAGDFLSAATFLGLTGFAFSFGGDMFIFAIGTTVGWALVLLLIAEPLRRLGRYTFADAVAARLAVKPIRILACVGVLAVSIPYLIAQIVGAGALVVNLFSINYEVAVTLAGLLMTIYVVIGGMIAATWLQIIKATILISGGLVLALLTLGYYDFGIFELLSRAADAHPQSDRIVGLGLGFSDAGSAFSLGLALSLGLAGFPHLMMRFFTVRDVKAARSSAAIAIAINALFMMFVFIIGLGAIDILHGDENYFNANGVIGGINLVAMHMSERLGGTVFLGVMSAVAFATILAVVAGLTLSLSSAVAHDLYGEIIAKGQPNPQKQMTISRLSVVACGILTIGLGLVFEGQNVAVMAAIATSIAASVNFPILLISLYWRGMTTQGAIAGGIVGLLVSVIATLLGPYVWVDVYGFSAPIFPYSYPTIVALPLAVMAIWLGSVCDQSTRGEAERGAYSAQKRKMLGRLEN